MADRRKLQGEVDRCLKKVSEGCEAFEDIWQKVQNATNVNQKEKYESELKKEIKKLQRLREQIKAWAASSDIKDKKMLLENRKLIELQMERFRIVEKETKTKAYSKEGLGQASKVDPETKEKEKCREWLNESIGNLNIQIDQMESEIESLTAGTKKKKLDKDKVERMDELNERIEKHRFHITQLEHILRLLDNQSMEVDEVNKVREDIEYYIDNNQEQDFEMDMDGIYDDLDLDVVGEGEGLKNHEDRDGEDSVHSSPSSSLTSSSFIGMPINSPAKSTTGSPRKNSKTSTSSISSTTSLSNGVTSVSPTTTTTITSTSTKRNLFSSSSLSHSLSSSSSTEGDTITTTATSLPAMVNGLDHPVIDTITATALSSLPFETPVSSVAPYASAAGPITTTTTAIVNTSIPGTSSLLSSFSTSNNILPSEEETAVQAVRNHVESLKHPGYNPNNSIWRGSSTTTQNESNPLVSSVTPSTAITSLMTSTSDVPSSVSTLDTSTASLETLPSLLSSTSRPMPSTISPMITSTQSTLNFPPVTSVSHKIDDTLSQQTTTDFSSLKTSSLFGGVINPATLVQKIPTTDTQEVRLQPVHGVAPLGPVLLSQERVKQLKMLDAAFHHLPQRQDSEKMRPYISRSAVPIASYHHHPPPPNIDSLEFFQRLSTETLFFIFYYQEGTRAQYLAAKALKKQSWRFHTKYMMWFQRHEEPKRITDEYEEGTYIFFDYEKWSQRKRDGFTFEYRYLEDKDLP